MHTVTDRSALRVTDTGSLAYELLYMQCFPALHTVIFQVPGFVFYRQNITVAKERLTKVSPPTLL